MIYLILTRTMNLIKENNPLYKKKIIRATTVPTSLVAFCSGLLKELSDKYEVIAVSSPGKELYKIHESDRIRVISVPMERHISIIKDMRSLWRMYKVFRKEKPYMVHSMTPKAGLICMVAGWIAHVPRRVHTFTGLVWPTSVGVKRKILMLADKIICACATNLIPEGHGVMNDLKIHITKKPMQVLGYGNVRGIDLNYWKTTNELRIRSIKLRRKLNANNTFNFIFVGRIVGDKGVNELVEAFIKLLSYSKNIKLLLVGKYETNLDPIAEVTRIKINSTPQIIVVGPQYGEDLKTHYAASDCFVFPSYREGFPNTPIEAGALNLPCIVTDINGSREIIENGKNGLIIKPKDVDALFESMRLIMENDAIRKKMAENARPMIASRFEQSFVRKCLFDYYDQIM